MDAEILCTLLAQRIDPAKFQLWGLEAHWMQEEHDTPENRANVADVVANYDTLAAIYVAERDAKIEEEEIKAGLVKIDLKSIRSLREWLVQQPNAPQFIKKDHEAAAIAERAKLQK
ncbi:MAG: hypothetical protein A4E72_01582 [Syntrophus sp. PtaU1.Bin208]|nr:MAG: hypothetical protein A4E72_01582 [Syntrophus sp. PtaU1.Bin208]